MSVSSGVGSWPGDDAAAYDEAARVVLGELDLPHLPELPGRGAHAGMVGRGLGLVTTDLGADLQPSGWRLTGGGAGVDQRRARSLLAQDLDVVEEHAHDLQRRFKVQVAGPWTLAATVERPRGDALLADHGARRELAQALAEGVRDHVADVRRRVPGAVGPGLVVQLDEPALPAVLAGAVPTASGFSRHRTVHPPEASALLEEVLAAVADAGAEPWVHCCSADVPVGLLRGAGAVGVLVDADRLAAGAHDALAETLEAGGVVGLGVVPTGGRSPGEGATGSVVVERVQRWLDMLGLDPTAYAERLVLTPACGMAGFSPATARRACGVLASAARALTA